MSVTKSELSVLRVLWEESPLTVGQIIERTQVQYDWHENTVKTLLSRLVDKAAVNRFKDGRRFFYEPLLSENDVLSEEAEGFLAQFFNGKMSPFIAHFAKNKKISKRELNEIEAIVDSLKGAEGKTRGRPKNGGDENAKAKVKNKRARRT